MKRTALLISLLLLAISLPGLHVPIAASRPDTLWHLGTTLVDNWSWLKDRDDPALQKHLKLEDKYCRAELAPTKQLSRRLGKEFLSWIPKQETSPTYSENGYVYYSKSQKSKTYPVHYRRAENPDAKEEMVLDENKLAKGKDYFALGIYAISPDNRYLAYSVDYLGNEIYSLEIKDLTSGKTRTTGISSISDFIWQDDSQHAIITRQNTRLQVDRCTRTDLNTLKEEELYRESDPAYDLSIYLTGDKRYIIMTADSKDVNEAYWLRSGDLKAKPRLIVPRDDQHQYYPEIFHDTLYCLTNLWDKDFSISQCPLDKPETANWKELLKADSGLPIIDFRVFDRHLAMLRRINGEKRLQIYSLPEIKLVDEIIPQGFADLNFWHRSEQGAQSFTYGVDSGLTPYCIYKYDLATGKRELVYQSPAAVQYRSQDYKEQTLYVPSWDGTKVPVDLICRAELSLDSPHALWLSGYGAYGDANDSWFSTSRLSLLNRGVIYAVAHIRGGGEYGNSWYEGGKLQNKRNTFKDYIACINYLTDNKITLPDSLIIEGGSAGGLLMGNVANEVPQKMKVVIADVPFVDLLNTMLDTSLPLTAQEYQEWGDPEQKDAFEYMKSYSPYDNIKPQAYPAMLISSAWFDTRVGYWEGLKWANKLRSNNLGNSPIVFRLLKNEGHTGTTDVESSLKELADSYAFALYQLRSRK